MSSSCALLVSTSPLRCHWLGETHQFTAVMWSTVALSLLKNWSRAYIALYGNSSRAGRGRCVFMHSHHTEAQKWWLSSIIFVYVCNLFSGKILLTSPLSKGSRPITEHKTWGAHHTTKQTKQKELSWWVKLSLPVWFPLLCDQIYPKSSSLSFRANLHLFEVHSFSCNVFESFSG